MSIEESGLTKDLRDRTKRTQGSEYRTTAQEHVSVQAQCPRKRSIEKKSVDPTRHLNRTKKEYLVNGIKFLILAFLAVVSVQLPAQADDYIVYSVFRGVDLGNPGEAPKKDFYVNMGGNQGLAAGSILQVYRRMPSYDLLSQKLYKDVTFPIAQLKVIHVEANVAVARLEKMLPAEQMPSITPAAVIVGDIIRKN